nr:pilot protein for DNA ejection [Microvirus sp.]
MSIWTSNPFSPSNDPLGSIYPNAKVSIGKSNSNPFGVTLGTDNTVHTNGRTGSDPLDYFNLGPDFKKDDPPASTSSSSQQEGWYDANGNFWPAVASYAYLDNIGNSSGKSLDYTNADLAKHYGMSRETAYQEALSNTSYQRSVKDMQAAGLNPAALFGAGRVSGADGVSYVSPVSSGGYGYASQSGSGYSRGSAKSTYRVNNGVYNLFKAAGMGIGFLATKNWSGALAGGTVASQLMRIYNGFAQK